MPGSPRVTRRAPTASQRFHAAPRSRPVFWLIGGIAGAFAIVAAFILLGGSRTDDGLPDRIAILETQAAKESRPEAAIKIYEQLISIAPGDGYTVPRAGWRSRIKELQEEIVLLREARAKLAAWETSAKAATADTARPLLEEGYRLRDAYRRLWKHDAHLERLIAVLPKPIPPWNEVNQKLVAEFKLEQRGVADWNGALLAWKDYLAKELPASDRAGAEGAVNTLQIRAREEAVSLVNKAAMPEEREALKRHRLRFAGTQAEATLEKGIAGR